MGEFKRVMYNTLACAMGRWRVNAEKLRPVETLYTEGEYEEL